VERLLKPRRWYTSQRQHWFSWLAEYSGPGTYEEGVTSATLLFAYNHCGCPPVVLWLSEASGMDERLVVPAAKSVMKTNGTFSAKCAAIGRVIPWHDIVRVL
jgi:hypothetical protein